ncbi:hypothetical protein HDV04_002139 [Boothiomyces sp. JEL0838]|nr:hypothetical protein HDV04_002139 [Boothiomyces sp. JEL0838]
MDSQFVIVLCVAIGITLAILGTVKVYYHKKRNSQILEDDSSYFEKDDELFTAIDVQVISQLQPAYLESEKRAINESFE